MNSFQHLSQADSTARSSRGRVRALIVAAALATLAAGTGATPAVAAPGVIPFQGIRASMTIHSPSSALEDVAAALDAVPNLPQSYLAPLKKNFAQGTLAG